MLGEQLKKIRTAKGLSVSELARRAEVSKSMISQIESGHANPSVETMQAIARALQEPMFLFFMQEGESLSTIVRKDRRVSFKIPGSEIERQLLTYDLNRALAMLLYRIPPGAQSSPTPGSHPGEECALVVSGELTVLLQDQVHTLQAGDTIYYESRLAHLYVNKSDADVEVLIAVTPPTLRSDRVEP